MVNRDQIWKKLTFGIKQRTTTNELNHSQLSCGISLKKDEPAPIILDKNYTTSTTSLVEEKIEDDEKTVKDPKILLGIKIATEKIGKRKTTLKFKAERSSKTLKREEENNIRKSNRIFVWGTDIPRPCTAFSDLDLPKQLIENLRNFGMNTPTPIQMQTIPLMLARREVLSSAPTGSGKTLAFLLPILLEVLRKKEANPKKKSHILAVILEPSRELAQQVFTEFTRLSDGFKINCSLLDKHFNIAETRKIDILISTPNRLSFLLNDDDSNHKFTLNKVHWLIVDESDRLFDSTEGMDSFRQQLASIYQACNGQRIRRAFFSATFSYEVEEWCKVNLDNMTMVCVGPRNSAVDTIAQELLFVGSEQGKLIALLQLLNDGFQPPALIFVQSKHRADQLAEHLNELNIPIGTVHGNRSQKERDDTMLAFRNGQIWLLICTEVLGRGIDFKDVNLVVNFDLPTSAISYIHRIGRTGRAGRPGRSVTYFTEQDIVVLRPIVNILKQAGCPVPDYLLRFQAPSRNTKKQLLRKAPRRRNIVQSAKANKWRKKRKTMIMSDNLQDTNE